MIRRAPHDIANTIRMSRSQDPRTVIIVEGRDDRLFMERHTSELACRVEVAEGKENVCEVLAILENDDFYGSLALIDADFDRIEDVHYRSDNILMPKHHDLIAMLLSSPALTEIMREFGSRPKLERFEENILQALIDRALPIGYLRLLSARNQLGLRFHGINYASWVDRISFLANTDALIEEVKNKSQRHDLSSVILRDGVNELYNAEYDPFEICSGTDLIEILAVGMRGVLGNNEATEVNADELKKSLRLAYSEQYFEVSNLRQDIETWEGRNTGFQVLRGHQA